AMACPRSGVRPVRSTPRNRCCLGKPFTNPCSLIIIRKQRLDRRDKLGRSIPRALKANPVNVPALPIAERLALEADGGEELLVTLFQKVRAVVEAVLRDLVPFPIRRHSVEVGNEVDARTHGVEAEPRDSARAHWLGFHRLTSCSCLALPLLLPALVDELRGRF